MAKVTENLKLYEKESTDGKDTFNIQQMLNDNWDKIENYTNTVNSQMADFVYQIASGTATAIILTIKGTLTNGYPITFIASADNGGSVTTINGKPLYKPNTTTTPTLVAGKAYTIWYSTANTCFFIKASAEGDAQASDVLAGKKFSNDNDTGLVGTMNLSNLVAGNIKDGVNINGVIGSLTVESLGGKKFATGTAASNNSFTISNLNFKSKIIYVYLTCEYGGGTIRCYDYYNSYTPDQVGYGAGMSVGSSDKNMNYDYTRKTYVSGVNPNGFLYSNNDNSVQNGDINQVFWFAIS